MATPYTLSKETLTASDLARFACCFLHTKDIANSIDWAAAAADFNPDLKPASFKTVTSKAFKRALACEGVGGKGKKRVVEDGEDGEGRKKVKTAATKAKAKGKGKGARKEEEEEDGEGEAAEANGDMTLEWDVKAEPATDEDD